MPVHAVPMPVHAVLMPVHVMQVHATMSFIDEFEENFEVFKENGIFSPLDPWKR